MGSQTVGVGIQKRRFSENGENDEVSVKNISRQNYRRKKTWSWLVRVCADRPNGKRKYFYDCDYGGSRKAKAVAERYLARLKKTLPAHFWHGTKGIAWGKGVSLRWYNSDYKGTMYSYLNASAHWVGLDGRRHQKMFSCTRYSIKNAQNLAKAYREKIIRELGYTKIQRGTR